MKSLLKYSPYVPFVFLVLIFSCSSVEPLSSPGQTAELPVPDHPRILLLEGEEEEIQQSVADNPYWRKMHDAILAESDIIMELPVSERVMVGRRLLGTSREVLRRVYYLAYSYRMTGDRNYLERAEDEMLAAAGFSDWNPSHFLDVAEMTMALAIGYDWLYDGLSANSRENIREAILKKGLEPSFNPDYNWFLEASHNWNQVCNAGMTYGALAIFEDHPDIATEVIERALESIPLAKEDYRPDGAYPEGYGYWGYGTSFDVMFLSAIEKAWPRGIDEETNAAFLKTGAFRKHMIAPSMENFNWGDNRSSSGLSPAMFWFADRNNRPSLLWKEIKFLERDDYSDFTGNRLLPGILIWGRDIPFDAITEPEEKFYVARGPMPVAIMRTSWTDPEAIFLGFKGGSPSVNHGHMDIGSFVMEADGIRWASDLGVQSYESLESRGMSIFGRSQDAERWTVYRLNNYSHSTLTVNGKLQRVDGYAKIERYSDDPAFSFAITDMTSLYGEDLVSSVRGAGIVDERYVVVRDELETGEQPASVRWQMLTEAEVEVTGENTAVLTGDGRRLLMRVDEPAGIEITTWSTDPGTDYDAPNPGTVLVGFETELPPYTEAELQVTLLPSGVDSDVEFHRSLSEWGEAATDRAAGIRTDLRDLEIIRERVVDELMEPAVDEKEIEELMAAQRADGTWPGINYQDTTRTAFEHRIHLDHMVSLARAYKKPGSPYQNHEGLKKTIRTALEYWLEHDFICENWWWNQIGTPERMANLLLLMDEALTEEQIRGTGPIAARATLDAWGARPGGDLIKIAGIMGKYGLFHRDRRVLDEAVQAIAEDIRFAVERGDTSDVRGLQKDYSFHHRHDRVTSTITYGLGFAEYFADWAEKVAGTVYEFPEESVELIVNFYLDGITKHMAFGRFPDPGAKNRGITRPGALNPRGPELPEKLLSVTNYREDELETIIRIRRGEQKPDLRSSTFFWHTEYYSHQRPHFFTSVRMYSGRNHSMEEPYNSEGLQNHHLADGYTFISRTGEEYTHIFPAWDWQKIPGTTVVQKPEMPGPGEVQQPGLTAFVGGVTDGLYGAAVFDFESPLDSLTARKSWFFFDDEFVALGADISSETGLPVNTTLNQSLLNGDVTVSTPEDRTLLSRGSHRQEDIRWVHHDSTVYFFPDPAEVWIENQTKTGAWEEISQQSWALAREPVKKELFTAWINHGTDPVDDKYAYIVIPGVSVLDADRYTSDSAVEIIDNTGYLQAVRHSGLNLSQAVFYEPGTVDIGGGIQISVEHPGMVMVKTDGETIEKITVSDPSRKLETFRLHTTSGLPESIPGDNMKVTGEKEGRKILEFALPDGEYAGQSVSVTFSE